jgi:hypothetical protein
VDKKLEIRKIVNRILKETDKELQLKERELEANIKYTAKEARATIPSEAKDGGT